MQIPKKVADVTLDVSVKEEACPMGIVPTASITAAMAMGDLDVHVVSPYNLISLRSSS